MADKDQFNTPNLENGLEIEDIFNEGTLSVFEDFGADRALLNSVNNELIRLGGSEVSVYKFLSSKNFDDLYDEERVKVLSPVPVGTYAHFDPVPIKENLTEFGIELTSELSFTFNREEIKKLLGRNLKAGDVIRPAFQNFFYAVYEVQEDSFESYGVYTLTAQARIWRDGDYIYNIRREHPEFPPGAIVEHTVASIMSDGYYMLMDIKFNIDNAEIAREGGSKLPVMIVSHTGPSNRGGPVAIALKWSSKEGGFFTIQQDIRGRGEPVSRNDPRFRGRSWENSIRHRLDLWEIIEFLYQGKAEGIGKGGETPFVFEYAKTAASLFDDLGRLIPTANIGTKKEGPMLIPHPLIDDFKLLMDIDNIHAIGFSLAGAVPLYMSVDSGLKYSSNMKTDKLVRYNYNTSTLQFSKSYMNPRSGAEDPTNGFRNYNSEDLYQTPGDPSDFPLQGFRSLKSIHAGGALINVWGHVTEGEWDGAVKQHFSFFAYAKKIDSTFDDPLQFWSNLYFKMFNTDVKGLWVNPVSLFPIEYWWEAWDWKSMRKFFLKGSNSNTDATLDFRKADFYTPSGLTHIDENIANTPWVFPPVYNYSGVNIKTYYSVTKPYYGWYKCMPIGIATVQAGVGIPQCNKKLGGKKFTEGRLYNNDDMKSGYQPNYELFGTVILPLLSSEFDSAEEWFDRWNSSDTNIAFYMGYDDIFMAPVNNIGYFLERAKKNKNAKTTFLCTHGAAHGTAPSNKEVSLIDKRERDWINYWAFKTPFPRDNKNFILSAMASTQSGFVDHIPAGAMTTVPKGDQYSNPLSTKSISQFDSWPAPIEYQIKVKLQDAKSSTIYNRFPIRHRLIFSSNDYITSNSGFYLDNGIIPWLADGGLDPISPIPSPGVSFRKYYRSNIEAYYKSGDWEHRMLVPSAIDINSESYSQFEGYQGKFEVPMVSSTNLSWNGKVLSKDHTLLGSVSAIIDVSANTGSFQIFVALYEVEPNGKENYVVGGLYSQVVETPPSSKTYRATFPLNPYYYKFSAGNKIRVKIWNFSIQQPPYVEQSSVEADGIPGSKFPITGGIFTGLPCFNEFELRISQSSKIMLPINNVISSFLI